MSKGEVSPTNHQPWKSFRVRQRDGDAKREAVLETAAHLFLERGYRRTSMRELASWLKITKPALYYYFQNKEQILVECYRAGIASIEALLDEAEAGKGNGLEKVKAYLEVYARAMVSHDFGRCVAMLDDSELSPAARREVRSLKRRIDASIREYIEEGIEDGSIAPRNVKLAAFAAAGAINWIGTWYRPEGGLTPEEIAADYAELLTQGMVRGGSAGRGKRGRGPGASRSRRAKK
jgi:AcrR family transcriptional regulator